MCTCLPSIDDVSDKVTFRALTVGASALEMLLSTFIARFLNSQSRSLLYDILPHGFTQSNGIVQIDAPWYWFCRGLRSKCYSILAAQLFGLFGFPYELPSPAYQCLWLLGIVQDCKASLSCFHIFQNDWSVLERPEKHTSSSCIVRWSLSSSRSFVVLFVLKTFDAAVAAILKIGNMLVNAWFYVPVTYTKNTQTRFNFHRHSGVWEYDGLEKWCTNWCVVVNAPKNRLPFAPLSYSNFVSVENITTSFGPHCEHYNSKASCNTTPVICCGEIMKTWRRWPKVKVSISDL